MSTTSLPLSPEKGLISNKEFIQKILGLVASTGIPIVKKNQYFEEKRQTVAYYNVPAAFDIEVTSFRKNEEKQACMYIWQFGILNWVTYGRTWEEFVKFISTLSAVLGLDEDKRLVVYIHNLAYEFQFMRRWFSWTKIFFLDERKPVYCISDNGIEFRCSYKLSSKSLAKVGEDLQKYKVLKKEGDLDYKLIRHSETPLSDEELGYCENDIRVVIAYIQEKIESDGSIALIPLTNTGYVRNYCRKSCFEMYQAYRALMRNLTISPSEYKQLKHGFAGGFTHGSALKVMGEQILADLRSYDFASAYPSVMVLEKFPMSKGRLVRLNDLKNPMEVFKQCLHKYCCLIDVTFYGLREKKGMEFEHPLSVSKCDNCEDVQEDNGRVVSATKVSTTLTEQDWFTMSEFYDVDTFEIHTLRIYIKAYLPKVFVKSILNLYKMKTKLKGVKGEEINYMISKNMLNSAYGMCVTDIVRDEIVFDNDTEDARKVYQKARKVKIAENPDDRDKINEEFVESAIEKYNTGGKRFLFYAWGVWVTAYCRRNLFSGIKECGRDYVYSDTDSIKLLNHKKHLKYFEDYNKKILDKIKEAAEFHGIDEEEFRPLNKPIGVWDDEGDIWYFKTLGAKRYLIRNKNGYLLTVAGLHKRNSLDYLLSQSIMQNVPLFEMFNPEMAIPSDSSGRLTHTYCDYPCSGSLVDYMGTVGEYHEKSFIHMEESSYEMTISDAYDDFLDALLGEEEFYDE